MSKKILAAKYATHISVAIAVSSVTRRFIGEYTEIESNSVPAHIAGALVGETVACQTDKLTSPAIDIVASKLRRDKSTDTETAPASAE